MRWFLAAWFSLAAGVANAQDQRSPLWYVTVFGGLNTIDDYERAEFFTVTASGRVPFRSSTTWRSFFDDQVTFGAAIGKRLLPRVRTEMEFAYQPVVGEARSVSGSGVERFEARATFNLEIITAGMNVWVDAFTIANVNVYVGSGLGVGFAEFDSKDVETAGFAQLGGGLQYLLNDRTWLDFGYRYQVSEPFFDSVRFDGHISRLGIGVAF